MTEKKCPTCGSNMGIGASTEENVKVLYECWCGRVVVEFFPEEELPKTFIDTPKSTPTSVTA